MCCCMCAVDVSQSRKMDNTAATIIESSGNIVEELNKTAASPSVQRVEIIYTGTEPLLKTAADELKLIRRLLRAYPAV